MSTTYPLPLVTSPFSLSHRVSLSLSLSLSLSHRLSLFLRVRQMLSACPQVSGSLRLSPGNCSLFSCSALDGNTLVMFVFPFTSIVNVMICGISNDSVLPWQQCVCAFSVCSDMVHRQLRTVTVTVHFKNVCVQAETWKTPYSTIYLAQHPVTTCHNNTINTSYSKRCIIDAL